MRRQYIQRVKRALCLSKEEKQEMIRDLQELFDSAVEHGETEEEVIARLGSPKEYVYHIHEQLGKMDEIQKRRKTRIRMGILWLLAVVLFLAGGIPLYLRTPAHMIGQADAMTQIQVSGSWIDPAWILMLLGVLALAAGIYLWIRHLRKRG
ncbi:MAG: DUF1700 domain-containing protein [Lachnospirales bacterium]